MSLKGWEKQVLRAPGAAARVAEIEEELRLAAGLTALREQAGYSQGISHVAWASPSPELRQSSSLETSRSTSSSSTWTRSAGSSR